MRMRHTEKPPLRSFLSGGFYFNLSVVHCDFAADKYHFNLQVGIEYHKISVFSNFYTADFIILMNFSGGVDCC